MLWGKLLYSVIFFFCEESLVRDTNLHNKDCSEMHSGSCSQMTSSCKCAIKGPSQPLLWFCLHLGTITEALSINALHACVFIYIRQLSTFRAPKLWFINLTVTTCHIQYPFLEFMSNSFHEKTDKTRKYVTYVWYENGRWWLLEVQIASY